MKNQVFFKFPLFLLFSSKYLPCLARRGAEKVMTEMTSFMMTQWHRDGSVGCTVQRDGS